MLKGTFIFYLVFFFSKLLLAQPNTVELKDGGGIVISSHASVTEAHNAIPNPLTQAYIIEILPAYDGSSETFPIVISERAGTSTNNTITLRPTAGNSGEVIATNLNNNPIINLNGIDYFILDGRPAGIGGLCRGPRVLQFLAQPLPGIGYGRRPVPHAGWPRGAGAADETAGVLWLCERGRLPGR